jgi:putative FmdB family regulatory protein
MPIYEYRCPECEHEFEHLVRSSRDGSKVSCPSCGAKRVEKRLSVFAAREGAASPAPAAGPCGQCCDPGGSCPYQ